MGEGSREVQQQGTSLRGLNLYTPIEQLGLVPATEHEVTMSLICVSHDRLTNKNGTGQTRRSKQL